MCELVKKIEIDLPNFPREVIRDWLLPYAKDIGWPPTHERWSGILFDKTIEFWRCAKWKKQNLELGKIAFSSTTVKIFKSLHDEYVKGEININSLNIENGKKRYNQALIYFIRHGKFPRPICLLLEKDEYSIVDGNHRFTAWFFASQLEIEIEKIKSREDQSQLEKFKKLLSEKCKIELISSIPPKQEAWVASVILQ